jgi:hypothetical protein
LIINIFTRYNHLVIQTTVVSVTTTVRVEREEGILVVGGFASALLTGLVEDRMDGDDDVEVSEVVEVAEVVETTLGFEVTVVANVASVSSVLGALELLWDRQALGPAGGQGPGLIASE